MNTCLLKNKGQDQQQIDYEYILDQRIKYGKFQLYNLSSALVAVVLDGVEIVILSIILPILKKEFDLTSGQQIMIAQTIFIGEIIGSYIGGYMGDKYGRKITLNIAIFVSFLFGLMSSFAYSVNSFIVMRIITATGVGMIITIAATQLDEFSSTSFKSKSQILFNQFFLVGGIFVQIVSFFSFDSVSDGDWRFLVRITSLVAVISFIMSFFQSQSIKYMLEKNQFDQAFNIINQAIIYNDPLVDRLTPTEEQQLIKYYTKKEVEQSDSFLVLFRPQFIKNTVFVSIQWFAATSSFFALVLLIPTQINNEMASDNSSSLVLLVLSNIPELIVSFFLMCTIDNKYMNNLQMSQLFYLISLFLILVSFLVDRKAAFIFIIKGFVAQNFNFSFILTSQIFPTFIKARAFGFCSLMGRVGGLLMPLVLYPALDNGISFFILTLLLFLVFFLALTAFIELEPQQENNTNLLK